MEPTKSAISCFIRESIDAEGILSSPIELGTHPCQPIQTIHFVVANCPSIYNIIIGRPTLNAIKDITSTYHLMVKFPTVWGIDVKRWKQLEPPELYEVANQPSKINRVNSIVIGNIRVDPKEIHNFDEIDPREPMIEQHGELVEELVEVPVFDNQRKLVRSRHPWPRSSEMS